MRNVALVLWSVAVLCAATVLCTGGCATGGVLASLSDEELPVEPPPSPYPTALHSSPVHSSVESPTDNAAPADSLSGALSTPPDPQPAAKVAQPPIPLAKTAAPIPLKQSTLLPIEMPHQFATAADDAGESAAPASEIARPPSTPQLDDGLPPVVNAADLKARPDSPTAPPAQTPLSEPPPLTAEVRSYDPAGAIDPTNTPPASTAPLPSIESTAPSISSPDDRLAAIGHQRDVLIAMLEEDLHHRRSAAEAATDQALPRLEQQLRILYAAADRPDDAARAVDSLTESEREGYKHLMFGVSTWLADGQPQRAPLRSARVLRSLRDAMGELAPAAKLDLTNLAFCERVESYGWFTEFVRNDFLPKQQVILYVEVENFTAAEKGPRSFETELQGSYQIFDARGNIVAERKLPLDREVCRNVRRDYFLAYPIYIPDSIAPGRYRLELSIEDLKAAGQYQGRKFGEASIEFTVRS